MGRTVYQSVPVCRKCILCQSLPCAGCGSGYRPVCGRKSGICLRYLRTGTQTNTPYQPPYSSHWQGGTGHVFGIFPKEKWQTEKTEDTTGVSNNSYHAWWDCGKKWGKWFCNRIGRAVGSVCGWNPRYFCKRAVHFGRKPIYRVWILRTWQAHESHGNACYDWEYYCQNQV